MHQQNVVRGPSRDHRKELFRPKWFITVTEFIQNGHFLHWMDSSLRAQTAWSIGTGCVRLRKVNVRVGQHHHSWAKVVLQTEAGTCFEDFRGIFPSRQENIRIHSQSLSNQSEIVLRKTPNTLQSALQQYLLFLSHIPKKLNLMSMLWHICSLHWDFGFWVSSKVAQRCVQRWLVCI